jgi:hypothetical protein
MAPTTAAEDSPRPILETTGLAPPASAAEVAALRERLRDVEAALGLPLRPGQSVPPDLPALRRRVAALERHLGIVPGLIPLPGCDGAAAPSRTTIITDEPAGRRPAWREWGQAVLLVAALLALLAWLLHPLPVGPGSARPAESPTLAAAPAPAEEVPARADYRAQHEGLSPAPGDPGNLRAAEATAPAIGPPCAFAEGCAREDPAGGAPPPQEDGHDNGPK